MHRPSTRKREGAVTKSIDITELAAIGAKLAAIRPRTEQVLAKGAGDIAAQAAVIAPIRTGHLRASIKPRRVSSDEYAVTAGAAYAGFVEYGTVHMRPRPYMRPATDAVIPSVEKALLEVGGKIF
jgi:bacteriophage protein of unknown function (DUF646)